MSTYPFTFLVILSFPVNQLQCNCGQLIQDKRPQIQTRIGISTKFDNKIVGGNQAPHLSIPWQVGLYNLVYNQVVCGGTIIGPYTIITAAHCIDEGQSLSNIGVFAGSTNVEKAPNNLYPVNETIIHPKYDGNNYDFAIMKLQVPIPFGKAANAACLPQDPSASYVNENLVVSGWGNMAATGELDQLDQFPDDLQVTFIFKSLLHSCKVSVYLVH